MLQVYLHHQLGDIFHRYIIPYFYFSLISVEGEGWKNNIDIWMNHLSLTSVQLFNFNCSTSDVISMYTVKWPNCIQEPNHIHNKNPTVSLYHQVNKNTGNSPYWEWYPNWERLIQREKNIKTLYRYLQA